jgi:hypothetical protein
MEKYPWRNTHGEIVKVKPGQMDETLRRAETEFLLQMSGTSFTCSGWTIQARQPR